MHLNFESTAKKPTKDRAYQFSCRTGKLAVMLMLLTCLVWLFASRHADQLGLNPASIAYSKSMTTKPRIAIVTFITSQNSYMYLSLRNKAQYAHRQGYDLIVDYESHASRGTTWLKFDMIERVINARMHDWIWWMDFDTLITNTTMSLMDIITDSLANTTKPADVDFIITNDCNNLNDGSFITRSSSRSIDALNAIRSLHDNEKAKGNTLNDQEAMRDFIKSDSGLAKYALRIPQWKINAFPEEIGCYDESKVKWARGMLVVHFAGAWAHVKEKDPTGFLMKKYESEII